MLKHMCWDYRRSYNLGWQMCPSPTPYAEMNLFVFFLSWPWSWEWLWSWSQFWNLQTGNSELITTITITDINYKCFILWPPFPASIVICMFILNKRHTCRTIYHENQVSPNMEHNLYITNTSYLLFIFHFSNLYSL